MTNDELFDRTYLKVTWTELDSGERKRQTLIEENCECMVNPGPEGPEGGWFLEPFLQDPDPHCNDCGGHGRFTYLKEEIYPPLDDSPIPF